MNYVIEVQQGLWGDDHAVRVLPVPKVQQTRLAEWERVALSGYREWLAFWGIEVSASPSRTLKYDIKLQAPASSTERMAWANLQAEALESSKARRPLTRLHKQAAMLERHYLQYFGYREFASDYPGWRKKYLSTGAALMRSHAASWVADRLALYIKDEDGKRWPCEMAVESLLEAVSAHCWLAAKRDRDLDLWTPITHLVARQHYAPPKDRVVKLGA